MVPASTHSDREAPPGHQVESRPGNGLSELGESGGFDGAHPFHPSDPKGPRRHLGGLVPGVALDRHLVIATAADDPVDPGAPKGVLHVLDEDAQEAVPGGPGLEEDLP